MPSLFSTQLNLENGGGDHFSSTNGAINQLYSFSLKLDDNGKDRALRVEAFDFWHCRMGHISVRCLEILSKVEGNGLSCCGDGLACDVCAIG